MKGNMISTFLIILTMTFSCVEKKAEIVEETKAVVEVVQENEVEKVTEEKAVDNEIVAVEKRADDSKNKTSSIKTNSKVVEAKTDSRESVKEKETIAVDENVFELKSNAENKSNIESKEIKNEETSKLKNIEKPIIAKPNHSVFNGLLQDHVSSKGVVDYSGLKKDIGKLDMYLKDLSDNSVSSDWSKDEKLSYWINAYNAFTIKLILDNFPVKSIQDINGGKPWDKKWINLGGKTYSLNQIENDVIRPQFKEPRIHFAVNCAAQSCPPLANKAYTAENLNSLLEKQTKTFINNSRFNKIGSKSVTISKIFDWYGVDFGDKIAFLNKYADTEISTKAKVEYSEYDWGLNNK